MPIRYALKEMGEKAADLVLKDDIIGLGSGSAVESFVNALSTKFESKELTVVPSSLQITQIADKFGLNIGSSKLLNKITIAFDGADQVDKNYNLIKGGGGALFRERIILLTAKKRVILADESKFAEFLDKQIPVETHIFARVSVSNSLKLLGGAPILRANQKGYPIFTENGNLIYDVDFGAVKTPIALHLKIKEIPGVIDSGLFSIPLDKIFKAKTDGSVDIIEPR